MATRDQHGGAAGVLLTNATSLARTILRVLLRIAHAQCFEMIRRDERRRTIRTEVAQFGIDQNRHALVRKWKYLAQDLRRDERRRTIRTEVAQFGIDQNRHALVRKWKYLAQDLRRDERRRTIRTEVAQF